MRVPMRRRPVASTIVRARSAVLIVVVALVTLTAASCSSPPPHMQFIGDSITALSSRDIHAHFDPRYDVDIHAFVGVTTAGMLQASREAGSTSPKVAIVNLGTNDVTCTSRYFTCSGPYSPAQHARTSGRSPPASRPRPA